MVRSQALVTDPVEDKVDIMLEQENILWRIDWFIQQNVIGVQDKFGTRGKGRSEIEFIKIINRRGPRMEPWGTPDGAATRLKDSPSKATHCLLVRQSKNHCSKRPDIPVLERNNIILSWGTESKAFSTSKKMEATWQFLDSIRCQSLVMDKRAS